jgi:outer membrane protein assembly factor BamE (lipoprotein component of BamABCDE complex)
VLSKKSSPHRDKIGDFEHLIDSRSNNSTIPSFSPNLAITFDQTKRETSNLNQNVHPDKFFDFDGDSKPRNNLQDNLNSKNCINMFSEQSYNF